MQLVNMDVDPYGTKPRCQIGPLSPGLNAICGPRGSGKTTLLSWLRQIAAENQGIPHHTTRWPIASAYQPPISGRVELRNRGITFQIHNDRNGHVSSASSHDGYPSDSSQRYSSWSAPAPALSPRQRDVFQALLAASGASDTEASLEGLARRLQLIGGVPTDSTAQRQRLLAREQELVLALERVSHLRSSREEVLEERRRIEAELQRTAPTRPVSDFTTDTRRLGERFELIEAELRNRQHELEQLEREIAAVRGELARCDAHAATPDIGESYRSQLKQLDDRLTRWRQTLRDLKAHRERIEYNATDARLDKQIGDQLGSTKESDPRVALRSLEAQILNTRAQLDRLVDRYGPASTIQRDGGYILPGQGPDVRRDATGQTRIAYGESYAIAPDTNLLPETLRSMQQDLHEVCQQLARHEATAAVETLRQQSQQLQRCEAELLQSVEKLIEERAALLRKIADEHHLSIEQLTLSFGQWCQCHDHLGLHDWLMRDEQITQTTDHEIAAKPHLLNELQRLEEQRKQVSVRCEECRRQLRDNDLVRRNRATHPWESSFVRSDPRHEQLLLELERVTAQLHEMDAREQSRLELVRVRQELAQLPLASASGDRFSTAFNRHVAGLVGPNHRQYLNRANAIHGSEYVARHYDNVNGTVVAQPVSYSEYEVPSAIVRIAMRLAIVEAMALQGEPIALLLDESLDGLTVEIQRAAVAYLASITGTNQQIIMLTGDEQIANLVRAHHGFVGYLTSAVLPADLDINRQLTAYANDLEAAKWSVPIEREPIAPIHAPRGDYYLTDRSLIEDLPSIESTAAARCRALGVDRIGDLLDVDPHWLADNLRIDGIGSSSVMRWQAEARLLCSVRKLRPFDARVLVGAGIRTPQQLSEMHPSHLLDRVERFLSTDRGRSILRSGSSYELTRITSWIAAAKTGPQRYQRTSLINSELGYDEIEQADFGYVANKTSAYNKTSVYDEEMQDRDSDYYRDNTRRAHRGRSYPTERSSRSNRSESNYDSYNGSTRGSHSNASRGARNTVRNADPTRVSREYPTLRHDQGSDSNVGEVSRRERRRAERTARPETGDLERSRRAPRETVRLATTQDSVETNERLKFYLELASPVVDAPSIGARMASRLEALGIITVDQLLAADAENLADRLNLRRVDGNVIRSWQEQSRLVCRIPNLRGHDAQLLVACGLTSPEELAHMDTADVLRQVLDVANSAEGQRILRGGKLPDHAEVTDWIAWAASSRSLNAA